jgi:hypothetical protein
MLLSSYQMYRFNRNVDRTIPNQEEENGNNVDHTEKQKAKFEGPNGSGAVPFDEEDPNFTSEQEEAKDTVAEKKVIFHVGVWLIPTVSTMIRKRRLTRYV